MKRFIISLVLICSSLLDSYFAQNKNIDSLKQIIKTVGQDTNHVKALASLGTIIGLNVRNYDTALVLYNQSLEIAKKLNYKKGMSVCFFNIGLVYEGQNKPSLAIQSYLSSLKAYEQINNKKGISNCFSQLGVIYTRKCNYLEGLMFQLRALKVREELNDTRGIATSCANIAYIYFDQKNDQKSLEYYSKALKIGEENGYKDLMAACYNSIGNIYRNKKKTDTSLEFSLKAANTYEEIGQLENIGLCYDNIGIIYGEKKNFIKAKEYFFKALKTQRQTNNKRDITVTYLNLVSLYNELNQSKNAIDYADSAIVLSKETGVIKAESFAYQQLSVAQGKLGNYKAAYEAQIEYQQLNDSIFNEENTKQLSDLNTKFEVEKKEAELKAEQEKKDVIVNEEKKKQRIILFSVLGVLCLLGILAVVIFRNLRQSKKTNKIIAQQKHLVEEKHKEITDSINYAERIQRSFLASKDLLNKNLKEYFVFFKPKDVVSGDFYWAASTSSATNNKFILCTADSTGHGVPGAIMSLLNITSLEKAIETESEPSRILDVTRKIIIDRLKKDGSTEGGKDGMDCSLCVFDFENKTLIVAAAHNPVWIVRSKETIEIKPNKMPVGKHDNDQTPFTQQEIELQSGDVVYALTDGFPDQFGGERGKKFMSKNLRELLANNAHLSMNEQYQLLETTFNNWKQDLEQVDDVTVIGVRV